LERGSLASALKDWERSRSAPPRLTLEVDPPPARDARNRLLVRATALTLRARVRGIPAARLAAARWQFDGGAPRELTPTPGGGPPARRRRPPGRPVRPALAARPARAAAAGPDHRGAGRRPQPDAHRPLPAAPADHRVPHRLGPAALRQGPGTGAPGRASGRLP